MSTCLLWFRNNLRLSDNAPVAQAYAYYSEVIPVYVWPFEGGEDRWGNPLLGTHRKQFLKESVASLQMKLRAEGSDLLVVSGDAVEVLQKLAKDVGAQAIIGPKEMAHQETVQEADLECWGAKAGVRVNFYLERTLYSLGDLPFTLQNWPETFSKFRNKVERKCKVIPSMEAPEISPAPTLPEGWAFQQLKPGSVNRDARTAVPFEGGITEAWAALDHYFWETDGVATYKETRNELLGRDFSSKFSPFLAVGSLSAREIFSELTRYEEEVTSNESTYWLFFELLWREYFQWGALAHGRKYFLKTGLEPEKPWKLGFNAKAFERWKSGTTGDAFVDANMRELAATGFMSNRGRQNVASYLIHDMGLDWRAGAAWFESQLIDYDPASNYGNWLYIAGRGNDPRPFRKFNTKGQAERYDPQGAFVKTWLD